MEGILQIMERKHRLDMRVKSANSSKRVSSSTEYNQESGKEAEVLPIDLMRKLMNEIMS